MTWKTWVSFAKHLSMRQFSFCETFFAVLMKQNITEFCKKIKQKESRKRGTRCEKVHERTWSTSRGSICSWSILTKRCFLPPTTSRSSGKHSTNVPGCRVAELQSLGTLNRGKWAVSIPGRVNRLQSCNHRPCTTICTRWVVRSTVASQPSSADTSIMACDTRLKLVRVNFYFNELFALLCDYSDLQRKWQREYRCW